MTRRSIKMGVLVGLMSVAMCGKVNIILAQTAPLIQPGQTATYTFQGAQIEELIAYAESQGYESSIQAFGYYLDGQEVNWQYSDNCTRSADSHYTLNARGDFGMFNHSTGHTQLSVRDTGCRFGFFEKKRLQPNWKILSVKVTRASTYCGKETQSSAIFSKNPIPLSDDASFQIRVWLAGEYWFAGQRCYRSILEARQDPYTRTLILRIQLQGPAMSDWHLAFRDPVTLPPRRR